MKTLVYIGVNKGYGLSRLLQNNQFDIVYAFEPDPELFDMIRPMFSKYPFVELIKMACSTETKLSTLFVTENRCSTSLSTPNVELFDPGCGSGINILKTIEVETVNLFEFLQNKKIEQIDYLVLDTQGNDYNILKTLESMIIEKKITTIFTETHKDNCYLYTGMDNQFCRFKELLTENYEISYFSADDRIISKDKNIEDCITANEWDTCWTLKETP